MPTPEPSKSIDISSIVAASIQHQNEAKAIDDTLSKGGEEYKSTTDSEISAIMQDAQLQSGITQAQGELQLRKEARNQESAAFFGTNPEAANAVQKQFAEQILQQHAELKKAGQNIIDLQNTKFTDDPVGWLYATFHVPQEIAAYNTREAVMKRDIETFKDLNAMTQSQVTTNNSIAATTSAAVVRMQADRALEAAKIRSANAQQEAAKFGVQLGSVRLATSRTQFESQLQVMQAQTALAHLQVSEASLRISDETKDLQRQNLQLLIDKRDKDAKDTAEFQANLDRATALLGMRRISAAEYERASPKTKEALFDTMANPNTNEGRLGSDTYDALRNVEQINAPLTPQLNQIRAQLNRESAAVVNKHPEWSSLKPEQQHVLIQKALMDKVTQEVGNIPDKDGFYSAPPIASLAGIPMVANTTLWKAVLAPMATNKTMPTSAQQIYDTAAMLVQDKKMPLEQAAKEISTIYKAILLDNNQQRDFNRFALPRQSDYRTSLNIGVSGIGVFSHKVVNMANESEVLNALLRSQAAKQRGVYREESTSSGNL